MRRAVSHHPAGHWPEAAEVASVTLPFDQRHRRRVRMQDDGGRAFLLDLTQATLLRDGDGLELAGGEGIIRVVAAAEAVLDIRCTDAAHLARVAWHLGNRHLAVQVIDGATLRITEDHVIEAMVRGLGAIPQHRVGAFEPEGGAYEGGGHGHSHTHGRQHGQEYGHDHGHTHAH